MPPRTGLEEVFTQPIDGTTFTGHIDDSEKSLHVHVTGDQFEKRGRNAMLTVGDRLRREGYILKQKSVAHKNDFEVIIKASYTGADEPISAEDTAFEVNLVLQDLRKLAYTKGQFTGELIGFDAALKEMQHPLHSVVINHVTDREDLHLSNKVIFPINDLRTAIDMALIDSHLDKEIKGKDGALGTPGAAEKLKIVSDVIIDSLREAQEMKLSATKRGDSSTISTRDIRRAIEAGLEEGLDRVNIPQDKRKDLMVDVMKEVFDSITRYKEKKEHGGR